MECGGVVAVDSLAVEGLVVEVGMMACAGVEDVLV